MMVPGHTKFRPDLLLSRIANKYNKTDVFNIQELLKVIISYKITERELETFEVRRNERRLRK